MNVFELFGTIAINNRAANEAIGDTTQKAERASTKISAAFRSIGSATLKIAKPIMAGAAAIGTAWVGAIESTRDYRTAMAQLDTAFLTNGHSAETAKNTYKALQTVLGDTDKAVEASTSLAQMVKNEEDLSKWTEICTGVFAEYQGKLPIEGLTEAANETAKVGVVTGNLADALNWAGISEDDFNLKLKACRTEEERQQLIMNTLYWTYKDASDQYKETGASVMKANAAQEKLNSALAKIGEIGEPIMTGLKGWIADMVTAAAPHIQTLVNKLVNFNETMTNEVWPWIQKEAKVRFGVDLPDWETFKGDVETWWTNTKTSIEKWCRFTLAFVGILPWNEENQAAMIEWWDSVYAKIGALCTWKLPNPLDLTEEDAQAVIKSIESWWSGITSRLKLTFGITPQVEAKMSAYKEDLQGPTKAKSIWDQMIYNSFIGNSDSFIKWNADGAVFNKPTIFNTPLGLQGAGEAGPEAIAPIGVLQRYVSDAVASQNAGTINILQSIHSALLDLNNTASKGSVIQLDSGVMVGQLAPAIDAELGMRTARKRRGN